MKVPRLAALFLAALLPAASADTARVLVTFHDALPAHDAWPATETDIPPPAIRWLATDFTFPRLAQRYDTFGIRDSWATPMMLRAAAEVRIAPGPTRFLIRARGLSRLSVNGEVIASTKALKGSSDGHNPVPPLPQPPIAGMRPVAYGMQEAFGTATVGEDGRCTVLFEAMIGGKKFRAADGEMCVAVQATGDATFTLLHPEGPATPLTDVGWTTAAARAEASLAALDDTNRHTAAATQDTFWEKRHDAARDWAKAHTPPAAPLNSIDAFLSDKIARAVAAAAGGMDAEGESFHKNVLPVLSDTCFRCHGEKSKGDLRLNTRPAALKAGTSGNAAIVPGEPASSELIARISSHDPDERMPPKGDALAPAQIAAIQSWIKVGAPWPAEPVPADEVAIPPLIGDAAFLRRAALDLIGVPPSEAEARAFLTDTTTDKRARFIDTLLADPRFADHWVSYWQDVLAENPSMLKPSLNNSGPFRWFLYDALRDAKPLDRMATELILLRGSKTEGGSAGFGVAADNDAPFAAKGQILGSAFLGLELQCARCHDAPFHESKQRDLYSLAAMLERKPVTVPKSSTVPAAFFEKKARESVIKVTLKPGEEIAPKWPFSKACGLADSAAIDSLMRDPHDTRERLAALITAPQNERFAQVIVNRVWKRLIGAGFVEPAHDWEGHAASHPELLAWLARDFVAHDYDLRHVVRLVMTSQIYQREATAQNRKAAPERRWFTAPDRRRLTAEEVVDSLYTAAGKKLEVEELTFDPDGRQAAGTMISLGAPTRAWQLASLSNERDRPSLSLPRAQAVSDVLNAFGWLGSRQNPLTDRETDPNVLQPGVLANSMMSTWITRASADSGLAALALDAKSPETLVNAVFMRFLTRPPTDSERADFSKALAPGFSERVLPADAVPDLTPLPRISKVSWSTHLMPEATTIKMEMERRARAGDPPDPRLAPDWRERYEDFVWAIINVPEFVWIP